MMNHYMVRKKVFTVELIGKIVYLNCSSTPFKIVFRTILLRLTTNLALESTLAVVMLYTLFEMSLSIM